MFIFIYVHEFDDDNIGYRVYSVFAFTVKEVRCAEFVTSDTFRPLVILSSQK